MERRHARSIAPQHNSRSGILHAAAAAQTARRGERCSSASPSQQPRYLSSVRHPFLSLCHATCTPDERAHGRRMPRPRDVVSASDHRRTQLSRRTSVRFSMPVAVLFAAAGCHAAQADIVYEAVRSSVRPETDSRTAVVNLLDAKGTLLKLKVQSAQCHVRPPCSRNFYRQGRPHGHRQPECRGMVIHMQRRNTADSNVTYRLCAQALASTSPGSEERFRARRLLPGMAKRLREVCQPPDSTSHISRIKTLAAH